ncbi:Alpha/Beta hydrolase protein [Kockovaella imperatae]|uniref:Alpha/Beta hydrolase protein n=1 Tax=Kockovaella imperatae TaxID=4999 RepID=A0A1Y1ULI4_9TREE|nr:Alpha/Beta hydrolase protein [Kockovaella imperatae]ORX38407.1 Alpha/Beta hydrolase protein [Kockovaella imperatae]
MGKEPTARTDPEGYLANRNFSRRLAKCPRTGLPVSYADFGDPDGVHVLYLLPSGCSRWLATIQDPLAKRYGIRLIAIDRPGVGAIPMVPLKDRIRSSCEMMVSVIEDLGIKLAHMIATSGGVYYALYLLLHHPEAFISSLNPPPFLYLVAPWSPLLPASHPDYYSSAFTWLPDKLIETSHLTVPHVMKVANTAYSAWVSSSEAVGSTWSYAKSLWSGQVPTPQRERQANSIPAPLPDTPSLSAGQAGNENVEQESDVESYGEASFQYFSRLWKSYPAVFTDVIQAYFMAENNGGVGQEHLLCLNRGPENTGHEWLENSVADLARVLADAQSTGRRRNEDDGLPIPRPLNVHIWWGWEDGMVPRQGQLWFNKVIQSHPKKLRVEVHNVPDGDHGDLMMRPEGVHVLYSLIRHQGQSTIKKEKEADL